MNEAAKIRVILNNSISRIHEQVGIISMCLEDIELTSVQKAELTILQEVITGLIEND